MSKRIVFDKAYAGDASLIGKHKLMPDMVANRLISEGIAHEAGSAEDAKKKAAKENEAAVKRNAEKEAERIRYAHEGPKKESKKERKARKKAERKAAPEVLKAEGDK